MSKELKRPDVTDYFDKDDKGHIASLDVDFASYQSALNEYIDQLERKLKEAEKVECCNCGNKIVEYKNLALGLCEECRKRTI